MALKIILLVVIIGMTMIVFSSVHLSAHSWMAPSHEAAQSDPSTVNQQSIESGQALFAGFCVQCHGTDGQGLPATTTQLGIDTPNLPKRLKTTVAVIFIGRSGSVEEKCPLLKKSSLQMKSGILSIISAPRRTDYPCG